MRGKCCAQPRCVNYTKLARVRTATSWCSRRRRWRSLVELDHRAGRGGRAGGGAVDRFSGLLLVISSSVAHDLYYRVLSPEASEEQRLRVGRTVIGLAVVVAGLFGIFPPGFVSQVVAFAFGLAAASFFPVITLGIFSKRVSTTPAVAGMITGISFTAFYILGSVYWGMPHWCFGIGPQGIGTIGMLLNFAVTLALTPLFPPPSDEVRRMIDAIREPEGVGPAVDIEAAIDH